MDKRRRKHSNNWNNQNKAEQSQGDLNSKKVFQFNHAQYEDAQGEREKQKAIAEIKAREIVCPMCGQVISDIASAMADKSSGNPVHFDCALNKVKETEKLNDNEKISYIGQGRFAVLYYENMRDQRTFSIKKIIEWENREQQSEWRDELSGLYSKIK